MKIDTLFKKLSPNTRKFTIDTIYGSLNLSRYESICLILTLFFPIEWVLVPLPMGRKKTADDTKIYSTHMQEFVNKVTH